MQKRKKIVQSGSPLKISEEPLFHFRAFIIGLTLSNFSIIWFHLKMLQKNILILHINLRWLSST